MSGRQVTPGDDDVSTGAAAVKQAGLRAKRACIRTPQSSLRATQCACLHGHNCHQKGAFAGRRRNHSMSIRGCLRQRFMASMFGPMMIAMFGAVLSRRMIGEQVVRVARLSRMP